MYNIFNPHKWAADKGLLSASYYRGSFLFFCVQCGRRSVIRIEFHPNNENELKF